MEEKTLKWKAERGREVIDISLLKTQTDTAVVGGTAVWGWLIQCSDPAGRFVFLLDLIALMHTADKVLSQQMTVQQGMLYIDRYIISNIKPS